MSALLVRRKLDVVGSKRRIWKLLLKSFVIMKNAVAVSG